MAEELILKKMNLTDEIVEFEKVKKSEKAFHSDRLKSS